jgi:hypothetical protein
MNHRLNEYEYKYLLGDNKFWDIKGAAWNIVMTFCERHQLGSFGNPSVKGLERMQEYEYRTGAERPIC